jgi:hypothetical protein
MLSLFDFPNPNITNEKRNATESPFLLNSVFIGERAKALARRLDADSPRDNAAKIRSAYRILFDRQPTQAELQLGLGFLKGGSNSAWPRYAQALLDSNEFLFVN